MKTSRQLRKWGMNMSLCRIITFICALATLIESSPAPMAGPQRVETSLPASVVFEEPLGGGSLDKVSDQSTHSPAGFSNKLECYNRTHGATYLLDSGDGAKPQMTFCVFIIGLVIVGALAYAGMRYLCYKLGMTNPPPPPPPTPGPSMTNGPPTNAPPDTNVTAYAYSMPPVLGIDTNGYVAELSGIAVYQIVDSSPSLTNEYGNPYLYYAVYTVQSSTDLLSWTNRCSVKEWVTGVEAGYQYTYTALYDPNGNVIQAYPLNLPIGSLVPPMTNSFLDGIFQRDGPGQFYRFAAH